MQRPYVFSMLCFMAGLMSSLFTLPARAQDASTVVLSEVNWGGSVRGTADEWFELANLSDDPVDVSGWIVTGVATGGEAITLAQETTLPAHGVIVIANYALGDATTLAAAPSLVTTSVSIPNRTIDIILATSEGRVIDELHDAGTPDFGSSAGPFASMERDLATLTWITATESRNILDATQLGSPGMVATALPSTEVTADVTETAPSIATTTDEAISAEAPTVTPESVADAATSTVVDAESALSEESETDEAAPTDAAVTTGTTDEEAVQDDGSTDHAVADTFTLDVIHEVPAEEPTSTPDAVEAAPIEELSSTEEAVDETPLIAEVEESIAATAPPTVADDVTPTEDVAAPVITTLVMVEESDDTEAATIPTTGNLILSEIVVTGDEWIELFNADDHAIDLGAWSVRDATGKATMLGATMLEPGGWFVVEKPSGKLNNDGDTVELVDGTGICVDALTYGTGSVPAPGDGESLSRTSQGWTVTTDVSKGFANPELSAESADLATTATLSDASSPPPSYADSDTPPPAVTTHASDAAAIDTSPAPDTPATPSRTYAIVATAAPVSTTATPSAAARSSSARSVKQRTPRTVTTLGGVADDTHVSMTGALIALPGTFGSQIAYLDGAQLYLYHADWPSLTLGDVVTVTGTVSTSRGEKRVKIASPNDIAVTGHAAVAAPTIDVLYDGLVGTLGRVRGTVLSRDGDTIVIRNDASDITVVAHENTGVRWASLTSTTVSITGVLRHVDGKLVLMPRSSEDVVEERTAPATPAAISTPTGFPTHAIVGMGILAGVLGVLGYWFVRARLFTHLSTSQI